MCYFNQWISWKYINKKVKNNPRRKEKIFGEISVRDTEVSVDGDPRKFANAVGILVYHERSFVGCRYFVN